MLAPTPDKTRLSLEAFLALPETQTPTELFDGEMIVSPAPSFRHQKLIYRLAKLIERLSGTEPHLAPVDVVLGPGTVAQPDVLWIAPDSPRCTERDGRLYGPPDLCVEVLSPSTARLDRTVKFTAYESAGVREYWVVEPSAETVEVWVLTEGVFAQQGVYRADQTFPSSVLAAQAVPVAEVFAP